MFAMRPLPRGEHARMRTWSNPEDVRLLAGILRFGTDDWSRVAAFVGSGRTKSQCHQRWTRGLDPRIAKENWTPQQDEVLLMLVALYGQKCWTRISKGLGNRCDVQCRYRYSVLQKESGFAAKMQTAKQKVLANPAVIGRPLIPLKTPKGKRAQAKAKALAASAPDESDKERLFAEEDRDQEMEEMYDSPEPQRAFEEDGSSDFDDSE
jgi:hypothetical protein